jgi:hypothetical protein
MALTERAICDTADRFLNAFWNEHQSSAEKIWTWKHKCDELDLQNKDQGISLSLSLSLPFGGVICI